MISLRMWSVVNILLSERLITSQDRYTETGCLRGGEIMMERIIGVLKMKRRNWAEPLSDGRTRIWRDKGPKWSAERQREKTGFSHGMRTSKGLAQQGDEGSFGSSPSLHGGCCWASFLSRQSSLIFSSFFCCWTASGPADLATDPLQNI